jgi:hypothetical protein
MHQLLSYHPDLTTALHPATIRKQLSPGHPFLSQPPLPYSPQPFPPDFSQYQPAFDPLSPARRAGIMLLIIGCLTIALGACAGLSGFMVPLDKLDQMMAQSHVDTSQFPSGIAPAEYMRAAFIGAAFLCAPLGIVTIVSGIFTRRGARWAMITGIVLCGLPLLYLVFVVLVALTKGMMNPQMIVGSLCMLLVPAALLSLTIAWLIQAVRNVPRVRYAQQQYQLQMLHYQQQQAAYQQQPSPPPPSPAPDDPWARGYGMTPPPPPPPPAG